MATDRAASLSGTHARQPHDQVHVPRWAPAVTLPLAVAGLAVSAYLTYAHYTTAAVLACPDTGVVNCLKVTTSPQSTLFGIAPVAVLGLAYFAAMTALTTPWVWRASWPPFGWARLAGAAGGMAMVIYLVYVELHVLRAICLYCTVVHVLTFLLFVAIVLGTALTAVDGGAGEPE